VDHEPRELGGLRAKPTDRQSDLAVEEPCGPCVNTRDVTELAILVEDHGRSLLRRVGEGPPDASGRRLELSDHRPPKIGVECVAVFHDEARRDLTPESGFRPPLALHLVEQPASGLVRRLVFEHGPEIDHGLRRIVAAVVEVREQETDLGVVLDAGRPLQRRQRVIGASGVDR